MLIPSVVKRWEFVATLLLPGKQGPLLLNLDIAFGAIYVVHSGRQQKNLSRERPIVQPFAQATTGRVTLNKTHKNMRAVPLHRDARARQPDNSVQILSSDRAAEEPEHGLRERKKAHLRLQIMETATNLIRERGYENTRVDDIVRILQISQPTFFRYFPTKEDILRQVGRNAYRHITKLLQSETSGEASTGERLLRFYQILSERVDADRRLWQAVTVAGAIRAIRSDLRGADETLHVDILTGIIAEGQRRSEVTCSFPAEHLAQFMEGIALNVYRQWAESEPGQVNLKERVSRAVDFFLRGAKA